MTAIRYFQINFQPHKWPTRKMDSPKYKPIPINKILSQRERGSSSNCFRKHYTRSRNNAFADMEMLRSLFCDEDAYLEVSCFFIEHITAQRIRGYKFYAMDWKFESYRKNKFTYIRKIIQYNYNSNIVAKRGRELFLM